MGILTAVAAPTFFDSLLFHRVESAARRVKADLELARTQARLTSASQSVTFANSAYTLSNTKSLDKPNAIYTVDLTKQPYSLDSATANFSNARDRLVRWLRHAHERRNRRPHGQVPSVHRDAQRHDRRRNHHEQPLGRPHRAGAGKLIRRRTITP